MTETGKSAPGTRSLEQLLSQNDVLFACAIAMVLATLLIPLPTFLLDILLAVSIAVSVATMVIVLSAREAIELSTFPSLLLFVTLFRLSLNVASTRLILLQGDAGQIIQTFGHFVVGGSLVIGLVVFLILVIIQFVVITKGAERISEVAARFNLDAMPGKQMSIDADLNAGLIAEDEARARRAKVARESEFYGAMDGASKFIRGDAIASLIIVLVNLVGGIVVGLSRGQSLTQSLQTYCTLAVGDGLVTQIPAVIISTASGFLISKTATQTNLSQDLVRQLLARSRPIGIAALLFAAMVFVPGFPKVPFALLALGTGILARLLAKYEREAAVKIEKPKAPADAESAPVEELLDVDRIAIFVGPRLIRTVDPRRQDSLFHRIGPLRKRFAQECGVVLPLVRLRDNVALEPTAYEIRLHGHTVSGGRVEPEKFLAMDPGTVSRPLRGQPTKEPVFGLPALWISADQKEEAELGGYTVVDPESVLVTHLAETLKRHAHEILSRDDVQKLIDRLREKQPALVAGLVPEIVSVGLLARCLQNLLRDGIPIRNLPLILEALGDHATRTKDAALLTELLRKVLARTITEQHADAAGRIMAVVLEPALEYELRTTMHKEGEAEALALPPDRALELARRIAAAWTAAMNDGHDKTVLVCDFRLRPHLAALLSRQLPQLPVLAYDEVAPGTPIQPVATVSLQAQPQPAAARAVPVPGRPAAERPARPRAELAPAAGT
ncbi:MAG: flagellar biosynthesis protein FlhA [Planctomycetes bacterium]|nr:flagellar biosynthesis protein FlhA [Planctomycetota bacterium]